MAVNPYLNKFSASNEQSLLENLVIESIKFYGIEVNYIPRELNNLDEVWQEDAISSYGTSYPIEVYIKSVDGYEGDGTFLSKFGIEIRDQVTFTVAKTRFEEELSSIRERPQEGDLIHLPILGDRVFKIMFVDHRDAFYQLGKLNSYNLKCEAFEYASERFNTGEGIPDMIPDTFSMDTAISGNTNFDIPNDASAENQEIHTQANSIIDFTVGSPFGSF